MKEYTRNEIELFLFEEDYEIAIPKIKEYAEKKDYYYVGLLGYCYAYGIGLPEDILKGIKLLKNAARNGDAQSCVYLGELYTNYQVIIPDYKEALKWYNLGAKYGSEICKVSAIEAKKFLKNFKETKLLSQHEAKTLFFFKKFPFVEKSVIYYASQNEPDFLIMASYLIKGSLLPVKNYDYANYLYKKAYKKDRALAEMTAKEIQTQFN